MKHMPEKKFLQMLDDLLETARANLAASYVKGKPDWDSVLDYLTMAKSWFNKK